MAKEYVNECVGCTSMGLPCIGASCPNRNVLRFYCDCCGSENDLYEFDGEELCEGCIQERLEMTEGTCECCHDEEVEVFAFEGQQLCWNCVLNQLVKVEE